MLRLSAAAQLLQFWAPQQAEALPSDAISIGRTPPRCSSSSFVELSEGAEPTEPAARCSRTPPLVGVTLRLPLPVFPQPQLGRLVLACPRTGLLARRVKIVERAWVPAAREAGQIAPNSDHVAGSAVAHVDIVVYGAVPRGGRDVL